MTDIRPSAEWPCISPILETTEDASTTPTVERDELVEGH